MNEVKWYKPWTWGNAEKDEESRSESLDDVLTSIMAYTASGVVINENTAMRLAAVWTCNRILAEGVASLPCHLYRKDGSGGKSRALDHPLHNILTLEPNPEMSAFSFFESGQTYLDIEGNFYAEIIRDGGGRVAALIPITEPVSIDVSGGRVVYRVGGKTYTQDKIFHVPALSYDGIRGLSPIAHARESLGISKAAEEYAANFFGNSATPSGVIEWEKTFTEKNKDVRERIKQDWKNKHGGSNRAGVAVLEGGMKFKPVSLPAKDFQFIEIRKFQREEIFGMFRVPPHMGGDLSRSTFSNIEHQSLEFVIHTIGPWLRRWEMAINRQLLTPAERKTYYAEFLVDSLLRGDIKSRYEAYSIGRQNGWLSANDVRARENMNPIEGGDVYLSPMNMIPTDQLGKDDGQRFLPLVRNAKERIETRRIAETKKREKRGELTEDHLKEIRSNLVAFAPTVFGPIIEALGYEKDLDPEFLIDGDPNQITRELLGGIHGK